MTHPVPSPAVHTQGVMPAYVTTVEVKASQITGLPILEAQAGERHKWIVPTQNGNFAPQSVSGAPSISANIGDYLVDVGNGNVSIEPKESFEANFSLKPVNHITLTMPADDMLCLCDILDGCIYTLENAKSASEEEKEALPFVVSRIREMQMRIRSSAIDLNV